MKVTANEKREAAGQAEVDPGALSLQMGQCSLSHSEIRQRVCIACLQYFFHASGVQLSDQLSLFLDFSSISGITCTTRSMIPAFAHFFAPNATLFCNVHLNMISLNIEGAVHAFRIRKSGRIQQNQIVLILAVLQPFAHIGPVSAMTNITQTI